jgi:hypothetical protein
MNRLPINIGFFDKKSSSPGIFPLTPALSPRQLFRPGRGSNFGSSLGARQRGEREIRNFFRNFFGTVETAATGRPRTIFLIAAREPAALSKP